MDTSLYDLWNWLIHLTFAQAWSEMVTVVTDPVVQQAAKGIGRAFVVWIGLMFLLKAFAPKTIQQRWPRH